MNSPQQQPPSVGALDAQFDELVCDITTRLEAGEAVEIEQLAAAHPLLAQRLRDLYPTLQAINELGHSMVYAADSEAEPVAGEAAASGAGERRVADLLGDFRLIREIGRGGMGVVYEAEQVSLNRRVALKILPFAGVLNSRQLQRFKNEALAAAQLDHPHIVDVLGVGCERSVHYYAMRLIDGQPLSEIIRSLSALQEQPTHNSNRSSVETRARGGGGSETSRFSLTEMSNPQQTSSASFFRAVARLGIEVAEALDFAHENGVIHRDIKPANLLVDANGKAWIADFGLAQIETNPELTLTGDLVGTLRYMSPEQTLGKRVVVDHRTDVYSLGTTLYELVAQRPAFPEEDRGELIRRISFEDPKPIRQLNRAVPAELATILQKCMAKNAADRYVSAADLAEDFRRLLDHRPIHAKAPTFFDRAVKWSIRHRAAVFWVALFLLFTSTISTVAALRLAGERSKVLRAEQETKQHLWKSHLTQTRATRRLGEAGQRFDGFEGIRRALALIPAEELSEEQQLLLRNEAIALTALADVRLEQRLLHDEDAILAALDERFERIATTGKNGEITVQRTSDRQTLIALPGAGVPVSEVVFSADQVHLAAKYQHHADSKAQCVVWNLTDGSRVFEFEMRPRGALDFSADGARLAAVMTDHHVSVFAVATGRVQATLPSEQRRPVLLSFHPDGKKVAVGYESEGDVDVYQIVDGARIARFHTSQIPFIIGWSPDQRHLATGCSDFSAFVWDLDSPARPVSVLRGHQAEVVNLAFVQDGRLLATSSHDGTIRLWNPLSGACECTIEGRLKSVDQDGKRLSIRVLGDRRWIEIHELARRDEVQTLVERRTLKGPFSLDIRGDGRLMIAGGPEGLRLWDLATQREVAELNLPGGMGLFHDARHELITVSPLGLFAWPMDESRKGLIRLGPPRILAQVLVPERLCWASLCPQKNLVAALCDWNRIALLDLASGRIHCELTIENSFECMALSHDGQWMATSAYGASTFCIWDVDRRQVVHRLPREGGYPNVCFGPGDEVLVTGADRGYRVWKVDGWQPLTQIPMQNGLRSPIAFSPRGSLAVVARSRFEAQLIDTTDWREVARLETSDPRQLSCFDFTPAGQVVVASEARLIRLWNLRRIHASLAEQGVPWTLAEYGESTSAPAPARVDSLSMEIDYGPKWRQLKDVHSLLENAGGAIQAGNFQRGIEMLERILAIDENHAPACNGLAWLLATGPLEHRDPERAVALAKRCVDRVPYNASYLNTLGAAQYRAHQLEACIATLEAAVRLGSEGGTAFDFLFLAMAHAKLGQHEKARDYFQKAETWRQKMASASADYRRQLRPYFQEAKRLLQELGAAPPVKTPHKPLE